MKEATPKETQMQRFIDNLKRQAEENPVLAIGVAAGLITAISKLIDANADMRNSRAWAREVARRSIKDRK
jgi:hypothetical protein